MTASDESLSIALITFYAIVVIPGFYCLYIHGRRGVSGWLYVLLMCVLRLAGNGLSLRAFKENEINPTAMIINGIGLSPLVMAAVGLLHEANYSIKRGLHWALNLPGMVGVHVMVIGGVALAAASKKNQALLKAGMIIFLLAWTALVVLTTLSHRMGRDRLSDEKKLLLAMTAAVPLIGVRIIYTVASVFATSRADGGSLPVQVIFGVLPEFLVMIVYVSAGIMTRGLGSVRYETNIRSEQEM